MSCSPPYREEFKRCIPSDGQAITDVEIIDTGSAVRVTWVDGATARFHAIWLRDNALDEATRAPGSGQRLITILDIPAQTRIAEATVEAGDGLALRFLPEDKRVAFPGAWLRARIYDRAAPAGAGWLPAGLETWDATLAPAIPVVGFGDAAGERAALAVWLAAVRRYGFAMMTGVPAESGAVCRVAELFGYVRETNYGRWFDVRAQVDPVNLAYTGLGLQAHTDNPYRDPVPTLQLLACLENSADGGESLVVDGFRAAQLLRDEAPDDFALLARYCARFEFAGSRDVRLRARRPVLELAPDGALVAVRFNNRSAAPFTDIPYDAMAAYYAAYRRFAGILERSDLAVEFRLEPGELFIVDNTRVLHSRRAFSGAGTRWLQGCYADRDGLLSTLAAIEDATQEAAE